MILSGCGTTRVVTTDSQPIPRDKPVEAMQGCDETLSELPADFPQYTVAAALDLLIANRIVDSTRYFSCKRNHDALVEWIDGE